MSENSWKQVEDIFHRALDHTSETRSAFLDEACGKNESLRGEVESLLAHDSENGLAIASRADPEPPQAIGLYRITGKLGQGGMGVVYRATDTKLGRDVAIKLLPSSFDEDTRRKARFIREAKVLASLNHPHICTIYGLEEIDGQPALVMELVEGETLAQRLANARLPPEELQRLATQLADALAAAHRGGVVHRDLKPANIMLTGSRDRVRVKILDFGLAKIDQAIQADPDTITEKGIVAGTLQYMSPEQLRGLPVTHHTDMFSFGVVLYEMVTGNRPFTGGSAIAVGDAILNEPPLAFGDNAAPEKLNAIVRKLLEKDPANRYASIDEVHHLLKELESSSRQPRPAWQLKKIAFTFGFTAVLIGLLAVWFWNRTSRERWARETAPAEIARLIDAGEYVRAAALTQDASSVLPMDQSLAALWIGATGEISIVSEPSGAQVSKRPYRGDPNKWETLGVTPLEKIRVPLEANVWRLTKPGYSTALIIAELAARPTPGFLNRKLRFVLRMWPQGSVPAEMVVVSGGSVGLTYPLAQSPVVPVKDFLIDRHEVTNEEYKRFMEAGGYRAREFWKQPMLKDGRAVDWEDAVGLFHDATGRPGPATWEVGDFPKGHEKYPVGGVSWYEAAAYAEFAGKSIPTAYHWMRASQSAGYTPLIASGSNFGGQGSQPVGNPNALSGFGTTDMAGNVKEWCLNDTRGARKLILGGGFGEPGYMFQHADAQSPWARRANFGFRCVKLDSPPAAAAAGYVNDLTRDYWSEKPVSDEVFKNYASLYRYDKGELNALVEEIPPAEGWSRTKVTFDAAYGGERMSADLFLPKSAEPPYQIIVYYPGGGAFGEDKLDLPSFEEGRGFLLKSGRAVIFPHYKGMFERRDGFIPGGKPPDFFRNHVIAWSKDLSRTLDYLETRRDIDNAKIAYFGDSHGAVQAAILLAVDKRVKVAVLSSGGFHPRHDLPEVDPFNFAKHMTAPVLQLGGRYDATFPLQSSQLPLFRALGASSVDKKQVIYEGSHGAFPRPGAVREVLDWLDKYLGRVRIHEPDKRGF